METDELADWLRLTLTPGVGNDAARKLLAAFGLPDSIFQQPSHALAQVVSSAQVAALGSAPAELGTLLEATLRWLHAPAADDQDSATRRIVTLGDSRYPGALLAMADPPLVLYVQGQNQHLHDMQCSIAIVGSRNPTPQGAANARQFAKVLGQAGLTIVSGMALGVDGAAHEGALDAVASTGTGLQRLATIAVVGTGLDRVYPSRHLDLARRIARHGLIISEYPIGTPPLGPNFPKRNRLIAALSSGTLVVEAALQSGSLITARLAAEQGKDVFAIPGSIHSTQSRGCHALIKQGAKLVESAQDVLEEAPWKGRTGAPVPLVQHGAAEALSLLDAAAGSLLQALGFEPTGLDALQARTGIDTARLQAQLMALELQEQVARLPGGLFQRRVRT